MQQAVTGKMPKGYFNFTKSPAYVGNQKKTAGLVGKVTNKNATPKKRKKLVSKIKGFNPTVYNKAKNSYFGIKPNK